MNWQTLQFDAIVASWWVHCASFEVRSSNWNNRSKTSFVQQPGKRYGNQENTTETKQYDKLQTVCEPVALMPWIYSYEHIPMNSIYTEFETASMVTVAMARWGPPVNSVSIWPNWSTLVNHKLWFNSKFNDRLPRCDRYDFQNPSAQPSADHAELEPVMPRNGAASSANVCQITNFVKVAIHTIAD